MAADAKTAHLDDGSTSASANRLESLLAAFQVGLFRYCLADCAVETNAMFDKLYRQFCDVGAAEDREYDSFWQILELSQRIASLSDMAGAKDWEIMLHDRQGSLRWVRLSLLRSTDECGRPVVDGLIEDISHRSHAKSNGLSRHQSTAKMRLLSRRESQVFGLVVTGLSNRVIASKLDIAEKTVEKHRANMMRKLNVQSVTDLVRIAMLDRYAVDGSQPVSVKPTRIAK